MTLLSAPICVGINAAAAATIATTSIAGHTMVAIPGGLTVRGSSAFKYAEPGWIWNSPYLLDETAVSESQYREALGLPINERILGDHPATLVTYDDAIEYIKRRGGGLVLPTEAQNENAARGPAVNVVELMEEEIGKYQPSDVPDFVYDRFENFVFKELGHIFSNAKSELFRRLIEDGRPFFGWRIFGTPSGRLTHDEAWFDRRLDPGTAAPVNSGPRNAYGLYNMAGNVLEWVQDWYEPYAYQQLGDVDPKGPENGDHKIARGGSWRGYHKMYLAAARRLENFSPAESFDDVGFRVAAPLASAE